MSLSSVQRWVMSVLAVSTIMHLAAGIVLAAGTVPSSRAYAREGLLVIAGVMGVAALAVGFLIHGRRPWSPWVLLGLVPALAGVWWFYLR